MLEVTEGADFSGLFEGKSDEVVFDAGGGFAKGLEVLLEPVAVPMAAEVQGAEDDGVVEPDALTSDAAPPVPEPVARVAPGNERSAESPFSGVKLERKPDGRLVIEAEPEAASQLAALFEGFAELLRQAARSSLQPPRGTT